MNYQKPQLYFSSEVQVAKSQKKAIVALESTVITHGLPFPDNFALLNDIEDIVRTHGAVPATIAVINGRYHIGLEEDEKNTLADLGCNNPSSLYKLAMRDLAFASTMKYSGGTTVSATMLLANLAEISVFATGGIGGVHRDYGITLDISQDIKALSEIPVIVVSAGSKAILDIPNTLEALETYAIPVIGWNTDYFPTFYSRSSPYGITRIDNLSDLVSLFNHHISLYRSGILVANPIPEIDEIPAKIIDPYIEEAVKMARLDGVSGKEITPYLLKYLSQATMGLSVKANLALIKNNAKLASLIAVIHNERMS